MNRNRQPDLNQPDSPERALDLVIVSDVASPFMEKYVATVQNPNNWWRVLTPNLILILNNLFLAGALYGLITSVMGQCYGWVIVFTVVATVNILIDVLAGFLIGRLRKVDLVRYFRLPLRKLLNLRLRVYETMVVNRVQSVMKMTGEVFMKHLRRLNYRTLYHDKTWKNRLIMNAIYELVPGKGQIETKKQKNSISTQLVPSFKLQAVAEKAAATSTTLWFTKQELHPGPGEKSQPDVIIACGQFNICLNLLEYIEKLEKNRDNTNANHDLIIGCKDLLLKDWNKFQDNPFWMVEEIHQGFAK
jgi:hypothetical protein